ncbi:MAG: hypothetical protein ACTHJU_12235 [Sphingopyxis sp.]
MARWRYWDVMALVAGAIPIFLALAASAIGLHYGGFMIFAGSAGSELWLASLLCVAIFLIGAVAGWRFGNRWLIASGGLLLALCAAPSLLLLAACFNGNCI